MLSRRGFFGAAAAGAAALPLDPDRLLWRPGAKLISVPASVRLPQLYQFGVILSNTQILLPGRDVMEAAERRLCANIDAALRYAGKQEARFLPLKLPPLSDSMPFAVFDSLGKLQNVRYVQAYDVGLDAFVLQVDCLVRI